MNIQDLLCEYASDHFHCFHEPRIFADIFLIPCRIQIFNEWLEADRNHISNSKELESKCNKPTWIHCHEPLDHCQPHRQLRRTPELESDKNENGQEGYLVKHIIVEIQLVTIDGQITILFQDASNDFLSVEGIDLE